MLTQTRQQTLTKHQTADRLGISRATLDNWTRAGRVPAIYHPLGPGHGRAVRYSWPAVCRALGLPVTFRA